VGEPAEVLGVERGRRARVGVRGHRVLLLPPGRAARSFGGAMAAAMLESSPVAMRSSTRTVGTLRSR